MSQRRRVAVLASGRGSNLAALLEAGRRGELPSVEFALVLSNVADAGALSIAARHGVPGFCIPHRDFGKDRAAHEAAMVTTLREHRIELVVLAGYMRMLAGPLLAAYAGRIINIHPSLLPTFTGLHAQRQALSAGVRMAGCTVHFVTPELDAGPIIAQAAVPVFPGDSEETLSARILAEEHRILPRALELLASGSVRMTGGRAVLAPRSPQGRLLLATGNAHKVQELRELLGDLAPIAITTKDVPPIPEPPEDSESYAENAWSKARAWQAATGLWVLADDSGLEVDGLGGAPGVRSARYAATSEERNARLLSALRDVPEEMRTARFVCAMVLAGPRGERFDCIGTCEGRIGFEARGAEGFGYDPVFIPEGRDGRHLAELSAAEKHAISHRGNAMRAMMPVLRSSL